MGLKVGQGSFDREGGSTMGEEYKGVEEYRLRGEEEVERG